MTKPTYKTANWDVFPDGLIEHRADGYFIAPDTLTHKDWNGPWYHWPVHMAEKNWVDVPEFCHAFRKAMSIAHPDAPDDWVTRSITRALEKAIEDLRYRQAEQWYMHAHPEVREQWAIPIGDFAKREEWWTALGADWDRANGSHVTPTAEATKEGATHEI